jgi:hypothetical protein
MYSDSQTFSFTVWSKLISIFITFIVDELVSKTLTDRFQLNESKRKELLVGFSRTEIELDPIAINNKSL